VQVGSAREGCTKNPVVVARRSRQRHHSTLYLATISQRFCAETTREALNALH
jgi:hypothetical protein